MNIQNKIALITAKVEILKLKADGHEWYCISKEVKEELEKTLKEIDGMLVMEDEL